MSELPRWARKNCEHCGSDVAFARTARKSKGEWVEIMIDFAASSVGTVPVQVSGDVLYGDAVSKQIASAMRAASRSLHTLHKQTCVKRNTSHRT